MGAAALCVQGPDVIADNGRYFVPLGGSALAIVDGFFWDSLWPTLEASLTAADTKVDSALA